MNIITEINKKIITHMTTILEEALNEEMGLTEMVETTEELVREVGRDIIMETIESIEESIRINIERQAKWVTQSKNREKTISTMLGDIHYQRTYYKNKLTGKFKYLTDEILDVEPHSRIDTGLKVDMLKKAQTMSYQKVVDCYDDISITSRSTIKNLIHKTSMENTNWPNQEAEKRQVRFLYIEADEDHVHQQKGKGLIMKLAYIHEGKNIVNPASKSKHKRKELIGAKYITGLYPKNDDFWFEVLNYLDAQYDLDFVETIFLSGDGAPWIQAGKEIIPNCHFVIDGFHLRKYIKTATGPYPAYETKLKNYVYKGKKEYVEAYFETIEANQHTQAELKRFDASKTYILGNWGSIQNRNKKGYVECSAESHVSHVLSERLSSRPLSWSKLGSETVAKLRVYTRNGGSIRDHLNSLKVIDMGNKEEIVKDKSIVKKKKEIYNEFAGNLTILDIGKRTNMYKVLKAIRSA